MQKNETKIYRGYRFRIYPTKDQKNQFGKLFSTVHFVFNTLRDRWIEDNRLDFQCELSRLIVQEPWLIIVNQSILNNAARQLEQACRKCKAEGTVPRKKYKNDSHASFTLASSKIELRSGKLYLGGQPGIRPVKTAQSRPLPSNARVFSVTISRNGAGHYYASLLCGFLRQAEPVPMAPMGRNSCYSDYHDPYYPSEESKYRYDMNGRPEVSRLRDTRVVGLDYSLSHFFIASDPLLIPDDQYLHRDRESREKIAAANRKLSHMQKGSRNFQNQRKRIAKLYERVANQRSDYLQKLSTEIANQYDIVCVETLDLIEMGQKRHSYARKVSDNGWADFVRMLDYKLKERGKILVKVDKWFASSKICHECHYINRELKVTDREWTCPVCGEKLDRDKNAALNIRDEGLRILRNRRRMQRNTLAEGRTRYNTDFEIDAESDPPGPDRTRDFSDDMNAFWSQGPYGWEYRGCAWDAQFYVTRMDDGTYDAGFDTGFNTDFDYDGNGFEGTRDCSDLTSGQRPSGSSKQERKFYVIKEETDTGKRYANYHTKNGKLKEG